MEDDPQRDISLPPEYSILEDGLAYHVLIFGALPGKEEGREIVTFTIHPNDKVRKRYNWRIGREIDPVTGNMKFKVAKIDLVPMNMYDDANKTWLYVKSFDHEPTELSQREEKLKIQLIQKDNKIELMDAQLLRQNEQLDMAINNPAKFIQQGTEVFKEALKGVTDILRKPEKE